MFDEYPRPQMERDSWIDLCGPWEYAFTCSDSVPSVWEGQITVPFSPEAPASGVGRLLQKGEYLWYRREVDFSGEGRVLIHFGAVDQTASVHVNGQKLAFHYGGYTPFTVDVTDALDENRHGELIVAVQDDSDDTGLAHGKQKIRRGGIWYTPQSGIWQPVWAECVPEEHIRSLRITPLYDESAVRIEAVPDGTVHFAGKDYPSPAVVPVPDFVPWSPENPHLYRFSVTLGSDEVKSYFAMRKFSEENGRLCLNGEPYFHNGVLDQGYNPDGLYTYASDADMCRDILLAKDMGFNTIRKHMKTEPARWYYHCDRIGMLVWQDIPCGGGPYTPVIANLPLITGKSRRDNAYKRFGREDESGRMRFMHEMEEIVTTLYNCPCIALWTLFNEGWGQFDAKEALEKIRAIDDTRTIDHASGWHDQKIGQVQSLHVYFRRYKYRPDGLGRAVLLSEFGGYNLRVQGHAWNKKDFGYSRCADAEELERKLRRLYEQQIAPAKREGLAGAIYTQLTDVEDELNGFVTYDRQVVKIPVETIREIVSI